MLPVLCCGGKNGEVRSARLTEMRSATAPIQTLNGLFKSGRLYRSHNRPPETANEKNCAGYPSTSRMNEYTWLDGGRVITSSDGM